jgi:hypothetical protein
MKTRKRIAKLTAEENHAWELAFRFYLTEGKSELRADTLAWRDLRLEFHRLEPFDGCR